MGSGASKSKERRNSPPPSSISSSRPTFTNEFGVHQSTYSSSMSANLVDDEALAWKLHQEEEDAAYAHRIQEQLNNSKGDEYEEQPTFSENLIKEEQKRTLEAVRTELQELRRTQRNMRKFIREEMKDINGLMQEVKATVEVSMSASSERDDVMGEDREFDSEQLRVRYVQECSRKRYYYNKLQEVKGNVRVFCRCRPGDKSKFCVETVSDQDINCKERGIKCRFDKVFVVNASQDQVYEEITPLMVSAVDGYCVCLFAYGQSGSGKTHTLFGSGDGIGLKAAKGILGLCDNNRHIQYQLKVSVIEVYNDQVHDLLCDKANSDMKQGKTSDELNIEGVSQEPVNTLADMARLVDMGTKGRRKSKKNQSHMLVILQVTGADRISNAVTRGSLILGDLASTDSADVRKSGDSQFAPSESLAVQRSFGALKEVLIKLRNGTGDANFRKSALTTLLQPFLGPDAKVCLFITINPQRENMNETVNSLQFGSSIKQPAQGLLS
ncbi:uncharacterized protein [Ptychodera flava]|uniref:uncharacterized protein n=1 Tax=Ptychodera flava TaxID=63121 RepID=UPI003969C78A